MSRSLHLRLPSRQPHRRALVADDEPNTRRALGTLLDAAGYEVATAAAADEALDLLADFAPDLVLADIEMPDIGDPRRIAALAPGECPAALILLARRELADAAVRGLAAGADGYLIKPIHAELLRLLAERLVDDRRLRGWVASVRTRQGANRALRRLIGASPRMQAVREALAQAAETRAPLLISGESGTGKLLAAGLVHQSRSPDQPFVPLACAGLREVELAAGLDRAGRGTLYLVEVADLPPGAQEALADLLAGRARPRDAADPRRSRRAAVIATTRCDLAALVEGGEFSAELWQLLRPISVVMPPLRERRADIPLLADYFLRQSCRARAGVEAPPVLTRGLASLLDRVWPGNVSELRSYVEARHTPMAAPEPAGPGGQ
jgi:DNA-binding NtrC family response regulator